MIPCSCAQSGGGLSHNHASVCWSFTVFKVSNRPGCTRSKLTWSVVEFTVQVPLTPYREKDSEPLYLFQEFEEDLREAVTGAALVETGHPGLIEI